MYPLHLSLRFLRHHWLMSLIGSFFVGASLVILVVVMSVMDGFQLRLRDTISGVSADLILTPRFDADFERFGRAVESRVPQVVATAPFEQTLTFVQKTGRIDPLEDKLQFAQVFGVDGLREQRINRFGEYLHTLVKEGRGLPNAGTPGLHSDVHVMRGLPTVRDLRDPFAVDPLDAASDTPGVILGAGLRREMGVNVGDLIRIAALRRRKSTARDGSAVEDYEQDWRTFRVTGIWQSGNHEKDQHCLFLDWRVVRDLWSQDLRRSSLRCRLEDPDDFGAALETLGERTRISQVIRESARDPDRINDWESAIRPETWRDENRTLVQAIESEKSMILIIAFLIVVAGTSSIFAAQWLLVSDKVREIGILRALGAGVGGVMAIFVLSGFCMGLVGSAGGTLVGLFVVDHIDAVHELVKVLTGRDVFDPTIYLFDRIPTAVDQAAVIRYAFAALVCTLIASAIPAMRAGLMDPARALHRE